MVPALFSLMLPFILTALGKALVAVGKIGGEMVISKLIEKTRKRQHEGEFLDGKHRNYGFISPGDGGWRQQIGGN